MDPVRGIYSTSDAVKHITSYTNPEFVSPFVSCTFSLPFVIWEGYRRLSVSLYTREEHLYVSFISTARFAGLGTAKLGVEWLSAADLTDSETKRAYSFANAHQEVLVNLYIPLNAVIVTIPWSHIVTPLEDRQLVVPRNVFLESEMMDLRQFCWDMRKIWKPRMTRPYAIDQAVRWLFYAMHPIWNQAPSEEKDKLVWLCQNLAIAIFLWGHRWIIQPSGDFHPCKLPETANMHRDTALVLTAISNQVLVWRKNSWSISGILQEDFLSVSSTYISIYEAYTF